MELRSKKELIKNFINKLNGKDNVEEAWTVFAEKSRVEELDKIISEENLKPEETKKFIENAFRDGELKSTGTGFAKILPPVSMFNKDNARSVKKSLALERLKEFFEKYFGI